MEIVRFWRQLQRPMQVGNRAVYIHPEDAPHVIGHDHTFNLDYPPATYLGDLLKAKVIVLMANGGYDEVETRAEFAADGAIDRQLSRICNPAPVNPADVSRYYVGLKVCEWVGSGQLAILNAVGYRSANLSKEPKNKAIARSLPSRRCHLECLRRVLLPAAHSGERLIVVKRWDIWDLNPETDKSNHVIFNNQPRGSSLSEHVRQEIRQYLREGE